MKTISLEDDVFAAVEKLTSPLFSHSDVIKKLLSGNVISSQNSQPPITKGKGESSLLAYVLSSNYRVQNSAIKRYLAILGWLCVHHGNDFKKVLEYKRGNRVYFGTQKAVEEGGNGQIHAKLIPNSSIWTLATLDNRSKRSILSDLLNLFGHTKDEIGVVLATIPDSDRGDDPLGFALGL